MKKSILCAALVASFAVASSAQATQFVQNGSFSELTNGLGLIGGGGNTTATGWTTTGYNIVTDNGSSTISSVALWDASDGTNSWNGLSPTGSGNFLAMDGDYGTAPVTQTITGLTIGQVYTLSFDYAFSQQKGYYGATIQSLAASLGGNSVFESGNYNLPSNGFSGWNTYTSTVTANNTSEVLSFLATGNLPIPPFALLTGVSLTAGAPAAVPEPATWAMMLVGLGAIGVGARRRGRDRAVA